MHNNKPTYTPIPNTEPRLELPLYRAGMPTFRALSEKKKKFSLV
jgi:hypothetical protein